MHKSIKKFEILFILFGIYLVLLLTYKTSFTLKPWEDEIIALTSNLSFFTRLDFLPNNSYENFSYGLTSGILSSVGGVVGWSITKDLVLTRVLNFIYIFLVQYSMTLYIFKNNKNFNHLYLIFFGLVQITLVPWWFSTLYLIAEVISTLLFVNALFIYKRNKRLALFLMGSAVIFGKFLMLIPTVLFFLSRLQISNFKNHMKDGVYYLLPFIFWYSLIFIKIGYDGIILYFDQFTGTLLGRADSGVQSLSSFGLATILENFNNSEARNWTLASLIRTSFSPFLLLFIVFKNRINIQNQFDIKFSSIFLGILGTYSWFWLLTPFKYMRQSTHFILIVIFISIYLFLYLHDMSSFYKTLLLLNLSLFLSDIKLVILFNIMVLVYYSNLFSKFNNYVKFENLLVLIFVLNLINMNDEVKDKDIFNTQFDSCSEDIFSEMCVEEYLFGRK